MPVEPMPSRWNFPDPSHAGEGEVVGLGGDLEPGTILAAYRHGIFPMPLRPRKLAWWSPQPRAVLPLDGVHASRRLRRSARRFEVRVDSAFEQVVEACADPRRPGAWIDPDIRMAYVRLHRLGWAHSVEAWSTRTGELEGGLYGIAIGGLFAGESMFHRATDASKVALLHLVDLLVAGEGGPEAAAQAGRLLDVQWRTDHLASLGAVEVDRERYGELLRRALSLPPPPAFAS
ncbi:MAG TPA: leucyl/phenylalanyl-tRNA--protein transferase [Candidatus Dormibacteraeota bacterium]|jgi:leucyl/phenylalanyl-tRNA--protein transferase